MKNKKRIIIGIILGVCILLSFAACSSQSTGNNSNISANQNNTQPSVNVGGTITYENINYKVNPLLSNNEKIDYVDFEESKNETITVVEFGWNYFQNDDGEGCKDILAMYYDNTLTNIQNGEQNILGSILCHRTNDMTTEWSYFDSANNLICKNVEHNLYDKNGNLIATKHEDGNIFYDLNGNIFDFNSLDPFIETVTGF